MMIFFICQNSFVVWFTSYLIFIHFSLWSWEIWLISSLIFYSLTIKVLNCHLFTLGIAISILTPTIIVLKEKGYMTNNNNLIFFFKSLFYYYFFSTSSSNTSVPSPSPLLVFATAWNKINPTHTLSFFFEQKTHFHDCHITPH